jgi:ketol-acid reductoisomerase
MARVFYDEDVDSTALRNETIAVIGYGIQGRAQALNLRDSGARVVVGNRQDAYRDQAEADAFDVVGIPDAVERGTIVLFLGCGDTPELTMLHIDSLAALFGEVARFDFSLVEVRRFSTTAYLAVHLNVELDWT